MVYAHPTASAKNDGDAVRSASRELRRAMQRRDSKAVQEMWWPEGEYIDANGHVLKASDIVSRLRESHPSNLAPAVECEPETTLRFLTPDVATESGKLDCQTKTDGRLPARRYTAIWVKHNGNWMLDSLHEAFVDEPTVSAHLQSLEFLIGEWVGTTEDAATLVSAHWGGEGNYILREFAFTHDSGETVLGTQRIGWDPVAGRIKSWTFDTQGGTAEETWRLDGKRWIVDTVDISPDGKQGKTSAIYTPGGEQSYTLDVTNAEVGESKLKPLRIEFRRAAGAR